MLPRKIQDSRELATKRYFICYAVSITALTFKSVIKQRAKTRILWFIFSQVFLDLVINSKLYRLKIRWCKRGMNHPANCLFWDRLLGARVSFSEKRKERISSTAVCSSFEFYTRCSCSRALSLQHCISKAASISRPQVGNANRFILGHTAIRVRTVIHVQREGVWPPDLGLHVPWKGI